MPENSLTIKVFEVRIHGKKQKKINVMVMGGGSERYSATRRRIIGIGKEINPQPNQ